MKTFGSKTSLRKTRLLLYRIPHLKNRHFDWKTETLKDPLHFLSKRLNKSCLHWKKHCHVSQYSQPWKGQTDRQQNRPAARETDSHLSHVLYEFKSFITHQGCKFNHPADCRSCPECWMKEISVTCWCTAVHFKPVITSVILSLQSLLQYTCHNNGFMFRPEY